MGDEHSSSRPVGLSPPPSAQPQLMLTLKKICVCEVRSLEPIECKIGKSYQAKTEKG